MRWRAFLCLFPIYILHIIMVYTLLKIFSFGLSTLVILLTVVLTQQIDFMLDKNPDQNINVGYELGVPLGLVCAINFSIFLWVKDKKPQSKWLFLSSSLVPFICFLFLQFIAPGLVS